MKVALLGATGRVGTRLISELVSRGHQVKAIARHPENLAKHEGVTMTAADVADEDALAGAIGGHDAVIHSVNFVNTVAEKVISAMKKANVARLLVVGGAGSLEVAPGLLLVNAPNFPAEYKTEALAGAAFLNKLRKEKELDWTFLSPPHSSLPANAPGNSASAKTSFW
jgi:putative NADH-flavin reductase